MDLKKNIYKHDAKMQKELDRVYKKITALENKSTSTTTTTESSTITLTAGSNITISGSYPSWTISASAGSGEANTASNLGSGEGIYSEKSGVDLQFKSLIAGSNITLTPSSTELEIAASPGVGVPTGGTTGQVLAKIDAIDYNTEWVDQSGGGGGITVYDTLYDLYSISSPSSGDTVFVLSTKLIYIFDGTYWRETTMGFIVSQYDRDRNLQLKIRAKNSYSPERLRDESNNHIDFYEKISTLAYLDVTSSGEIALYMNSTTIYYRPGKDKRIFQDNDNVFFFMVHESAATNGQYHIYDKDQETAGSRLICGSTSGKMRIYDQVGGTDTVGSTSVGTGTRRVLAWKLRDGETGKGYLDGTLDLTTSNTYDATRVWSQTSLLGVGHTVSTFGRTLEIRAYNGDMTDTEFDDVISELKTTYGV